MEKINTTSKTQPPIYIQISQDLRNLIIKGHFQQGDQIPTEDELVMKYGVSRMTARNAVTELVNEGLVFRVHGKGAFVARAKLQRSLNKITGFHQDMLEMGLNPKARVLDFEKRLPTEKECHRLNLRKYNKVFSIKRIRYIDEIPFGYQELIVPEFQAPKLDSLNLETESLYSYLKDIDKPIKNAEQRMEAVMDAHIAEVLGTPVEIPFFFFDRTSYLVDGTPVELLHSYFRGDKFSYTVSLSN
ncbi:GntR family transcriptional regulator [Mesobacillus harenae]|uniref:GntR family transcriptional regulator n=1 Tax=Mesobacillus harenae TaxID=2213203 RepID=UPI00157FC718|nr:GntR family transcriptional regulator [Mesobacillus harenae]